MPKIKSYWTTSQNMQQIQNMSTRKALSKGGGQRKRDLILVIKKKKKGNVILPFFGSKLTQLGRHSNITCLGLSVLTGETKESILHLATTLFKLSFWGLKYSYLNGQFFIFLTLYPCWTTRQRPTRYWAIRPHPLSAILPTSHRRKLLKGEVIWLNLKPTVIHWKYIIHLILY